MLHQLQLQNLLRLAANGMTVPVCAIQELQTLRQQVTDLARQVTRVYLAEDATADADQVGLTSLFYASTLPQL